MSVFAQAVCLFIAMVSFGAAGFFLLWVDTLPRKPRRLRRRYNRATRPGKA